MSFIYLFFKNIIYTFIYFFVLFQEAIAPDCDSDTIQLKKVLEWELSLDARDLRSHAWYHGAIPRVRAEEIVGDQDGDFLVRDCTSQPGNYVLSCRSKGQNLHFVINKVCNEHMKFLYHEICVLIISVR